MRSIQPLPLSPHRTNACFDVRGENGSLTMQSSFLFHLSSGHQFSSALFTQQEAMEFLSRGLVLTSSLVITTDCRLQSDCFQLLTGFNNCGTAAGSYSQKHVRKSRYSVSFGSRSRSVHSARADFPTPKQELTLLERDFLLVLRLGAQIGI